jgi:hypothetical protein
MIAYLIGRSIGVAIVATLVLTGHWLLAGAYVTLWVCEPRELR